MGLWIVIGVIVLVVLAYIGMYNSLVSLRNQVKNAWSQIDVQLKRRHDLIPNLIETVKGYVKHERDTLENITKARTNAMQASGAAAAGKAEGELSGAISKLMLVVENYPELKANQNFLALQEELSSTENKVGFSRQFYNDAVLRFNTKVETFPSNIVANMFGFKQAEFFEIQVATEREAPKVQF
ncbi:MAG TPA: LemA family protein [Kiritimatiellia bacterium]|nr:LemA family protein [Kiritimatiellia bacterium]HRZ11034.1 LemA family protein [Kiritimatiellia bacterium]HSA18607.1 LemA family protein [Kiritimatiellia bacterium]